LTIFIAAYSLANESRDARTRRTQVRTLAPSLFFCHNQFIAMIADPDIQKAAQILRSGGLVVFPTETVYGLGANALDPSAIRKIYALKGRPATSPLIVHVASIEQARDLAAEWPQEAERLAREYWPGPLTLVVPKKAVIPDEATAGLPTVGLRMPRHPVALALLREVGFPIAAPAPTASHNFPPPRHSTFAKPLVTTRRFSSMAARAKSASNPR